MTPEAVAASLEKMITMAEGRFEAAKVKMVRHCVANPERYIEALHDSIFLEGIGMGYKDAYRMVTGRDFRSGES